MHKCSACAQHTHVRGTRHAARGTRHAHARARAHTSAHTHARARARAHTTHAHTTRTHTTTAQEDKDRLWVEADYFGLPGLCDLLLGCGYARALTEDDARMRAAEDKQLSMVKRASSTAAVLLATVGRGPAMRAQGGP